MRVAQVAGIIVSATVLLIAASLQLERLPFGNSAAVPVDTAVSPLISGDYLVAAPGRVESASEEIFIGASVTGVLKEIAVKEGDRVRRGDVLARIENDDLAASLGQAIAQVRLQEAELQRVMNGAQAAERREASAAVEAAEAVEKNAKAEFERERMLASASIASRVTLEQAQTQFEVAHQKYQEAVEKYNLVNDPTRDEDVAIAQAKLDAARAARDAAQAMLDKSVIQSPIDGTVLRVFRHPGELISVFMNEPVLSMGDISTLNVRAEIDEADIARVKPGLPVYVTAEAYGQQRFTGHVLRLGEVLGKKSLVTNEPGERTDSNVLEALVQLDAPNPLRPGLRVDTFILRPESDAAGKQETSKSSMQILQQNNPEEPR